MRIEARSHASMSVQSSMVSARYRPLSFVLKGIDSEHPLVDTLRLTRETIETFGIGYFAGRGIMRHKIVIPFHNKDGLLVAYAGCSPDDRSIAFPGNFDRRLELYNIYRAEHAGLFQDGLVLVTDLLNVLRLHELGVDRVAALSTESLSATHLWLIRNLVGSRGRVDFVPWSIEYSDNLRLLAEHFHVHLHRYYEGSEDEFLTQVVYSLGW